MISNDFNPWKNFDNYHEQMFDDKSSDLVQWPVKLWKVPIVSPYFHHAHTGVGIPRIFRPALTVPVLP